MISSNCKRTAIVLVRKKPLKILTLRGLASSVGDHKQVKGKHYDVAIAGGGMVGTTLACSLGKNKILSNKNIILLEGCNAKSYNYNSEKYSNRVVAINQSTINLLKSIDAWKHIEAVRFGVVEKMQVWDGISDSMITFEKSIDEDGLAFIIENDLLLSSVGKEVKNCGNVEVAYGAKIKKYELPDHERDMTKVHLENGDVITCNLLIGCDGANSQVRRMMGVHYINWNYKQTAVVATLQIKSENTDNKVAWQRLLTTGPVALLPLTKDLSSLVWCTTTQHAEELLKLPDDQFVDSLNSAIWSTHKRHEIIDKVTKCLDNLFAYLNFPPNSVRQLPPTIVSCHEGSRAAFPLGFGHASSYIAKGVVLVGDAAHRVHPLAGQGVNLGFGDVICLNKILGDALYAGSRIDSMNYLRLYESERQKHNIPTMFAIDGIHRLYTCDWAPLVLLRSIGLQTTNILSPVKKVIMTHAAA